MTKKQKETNGDNFSRIIDDAAILLQRKADYVMNIKQVANYLGISTDAVRKRCQRGQLPFHRSASRLYFSRMEIDDAISINKLLLKYGGRTCRRVVDRQQRRLKFVKTK